MISVDTNFLVRLLVRDDLEQVRVVEHALRRCVERKDKCLITLIVLAELEWVLGSVYSVPREEIASSIQSLLTTEPFRLESPETVQSSLDEYRRGSGDFSDYLLGCRALELGAETTLTFDRKLWRSPWFATP